MSAAATSSPLQHLGIAHDERGSRPPEGIIVQNSPQDAFDNLRNGVVPMNAGNHVAPQYDSGASSTVFPMDTLLAKLTEQEAAIRAQNEKMMKNAAETEAFARAMECQYTGNPGTIGQPVNRSVAPNVPTSNDSSSVPNPSVQEVLRLKIELAQAQLKLSRYQQQQTTADAMKSESMNTIPVARTEPSFPVAPGFEYSAARAAAKLASTSVVKPLYAKDNIWAQPDQGRMSTAGSFTSNSIAQTRSLWDDDIKPSGFPSPFTTASPAATVADALPSQPAASFWPPPRPANNSFPESSTPAFANLSASMDAGGYSDRLAPDNDLFLRPASRRRNLRLDNRVTSNQPLGAFAGFNTGPSAIDARNDFSPSATQNLKDNLYSQYQPQPIGTPLSPHATEFTNASAPMWKSEPGVPVVEPQTFMSMTEPMNYRRLLDRNASCNWKFIVDKIVCSNDQQASIFLQQKLKVGTPDQKYDIVEAIIAQAYSLMINRFGNFLVQRCFEHGTPDQIINIAECIRGNTLSLSMDPFGCHVVQKALDTVTDDYKAVIVQELLRRIPDTVIHRYACHVWQKLFELRWHDSPPQIMKCVNDALGGMWHEVALGETGSLVVQNIFENCLEEDKRPCVEEVLANIDMIAHGQFGNWCIQHICENGAPNDRGRAIDHVIRFAAEYSMDQFASKVVEKCLKIGGPEFTGRYLDRVCEGCIDRPRIPLIDIASDQYGNYLIQYILTRGTQQHRELVAAHIRKHIVSLRGSKFGSRVGMLCTNPAVVTRPGPGVGPTINRLSPRYNGYR